MYKQHIVFLLLVGLISSLMSACSSSGDVDEEPADLVEIKKKIKIIPLWKKKFKTNKDDELLDLSPAIEDGVLYTSDSRGNLYKLDSKNGKEIWKIKKKIKITSPIVINNNKLIFGSRTGRIYALNKENGNVVWDEELSSEVLARPASGGGIIAFRTNDGKLYGVNTTTGKYFWVYERKVPPLSLRGTGSPIVDKKSLYVGFDNGKLISLSLDAGKVKWEATVALPSGRSDLERMVDIDADPLIQNGVIYAVSFQGKIAAMNKDTGRNIWSRDMSSYSGMTIDDKFLYVSDAGGNVWALDINNGASFWKQDKLKARGLTAPVLFKDYIVVGDYQGYLHFIAKKDGELVGRIRVAKSPIRITPISKDQKLMARTVSGVLAAFDTK